MIERKTGSALEKLLSDEILRSLVSQFSHLQPKKGPAIVPLPNLFTLNTTFKIGGAVYGLNLIQLPSKVVDFLRELIEARESQDPAKLAQFLAETGEFPDGFFTQPLGQFKDPIKPITLAQLNTALTDMITNNRIIFVNVSSEKNE